MLRNIAYATALFTCLSTASYAEQAIKAGEAIVLPKVDPGKMKPSVAAPVDYPNPVGKAGKTYTVDRTTRGSTVAIPEGDIIQYCSDKSGCIVRIGMHNWDDKGRVASRHFLYNKDTGVWRSEAGDVEGTNNNNVTEHVSQAWACYFTDGQYQNWQDKGDTSKDFGLLSWNQFNADCFLSLTP